MEILHQVNKYTVTFEINDDVEPTDEMVPNQNSVTCTQNTKVCKYIDNIHHIRETELESVSHAVYLDTELVDKLMWTKHMNQTTAKVTWTLIFVRLNLCVASQNIRETAYKTMVVPSRSMPA